MKRLMIAWAVAFMPLLLTTASAQLLMKNHYEGRQDASHYAVGAVTESDGKVVFAKDIVAEGKTASELFYAVGQWAELRYMPGTTRGEWYDPAFFHNYEFANIMTADADQHTIVCQGDEELLFTNKVLNRDAARINYQLRIKTEDSAVRVELSQITYTYTFVEQPERVTAEEWISDKEAFNKKGKMLKSVARFRVKTIDLKDELFKEIEEAVK